MLIASRNSRLRLAHDQSCRFAKRTRKENRLIFASVSEAMQRGYEVCPHCCEIARRYRNNRKHIDQFCADSGLRLLRDRGRLFVISAKDTAWYIVSPKEDGKIALYHESKYNVGYDRSEKAYENREYHLQNTHSTSILGYLVYIRNHDAYDEERTKKQAVERAIRNEEVRSVRAAQRQIERQNKKHRKNDRFKSHGQKRKRANQQLGALAASFSDYQSAKIAMA